jgi:hypothetical protein
LLPAFPPPPTTNTKNVEPDIALGAVHVMEPVIITKVGVINPTTKRLEINLFEYKPDDIF